MGTSGAERSGDNRGDGEDLIHREILQVAVLIVIAVVGFFVT
jgi:hypothetical protein